MSKFLLSPFSAAAVLACTALLPAAFAQEAAKPAAAPAAAADGFVSLFDGKTLAGWANPYSFGKAEVVNGEIHLTAEKKFFLCTEKPYANFVFEGDVHLPEGKANSGFIFRGIVKENAKKEKSVVGYQAEVDGDDKRGWSGGLYDEGLRGWFISPKKGDAASEAAFKARSAGAFKRNDWNKQSVRHNDGDCRSDER